ncbi:methyltransferase domain-containing protein [Selenomonas sp. oral taxon 138]|uniref:methyltransferase domain-containing protein n=1 Tax=Selenomonas sp. oral taxon 138 TaxID=712532 RepID=UPI00034806EA
MIEHLLDPWSAIRNMRELLVPGGSIVASIPNVAHISNLYHVLCGRWTYEDMGVRDRTHFRFFTKYEIVQVFENAGFMVDEIQPRKLPLDAQWQEFRDEILSLQMVHVNAEDLDAYQWVVRVQRT